MSEKPRSIWQRFFEDLIAGNPLIFMTILIVVVGVAGVWVWQKINEPPVYQIRKPEFTHPTIVSPSSVLTARAEKITPKVTPTPKAGFMFQPKTRPNIFSVDKRVVVRLQ